MTNGYKCSVPIQHRSWFSATKFKLFRAYKMVLGNRNSITAGRKQQKKPAIVCKLLKRLEFLDVKTYISLRLYYYDAEIEGYRF